MKRTILLIAAVLFAFTFSYAQDTIVLNSNDTIMCKINKVSDTTIAYTLKGYKKSMTLSDIKKYSVSESSGNVEITATTPAFKFDENIPVSTYVTELNAEIDNINLRLNTHHEKFKSGITVSLIGTSLGAIGTAIAIGATDTSQRNVGAGLALAGFGTAMIGYVIIIDSDKWFGKKRMK